MTPEELTLKQYEIDAEIKRQDIRAGVLKVVYGTMVVGVAAAVFPFAQEYATAYFQAKAEIMKKEADARIEMERVELDREREDKDVTSLNRTFLASIATEGRSKNLEDRIILAEYYLYLADDEEEQARWKAFYDHLIQLRQEQRDAAVLAATTAVNPDSSAAEIAETATKARLLSESAAAGGAEQGPPAQATPAAAAGGAPDLELLIEQLSAEDAYTRRLARSTLAALGIELVRPAMIALSDDAISYRRRLGFVVALTEMLRANKSLRAKIIELIQPDELETLLIAATDADRTLRIHAAEFLFDLGDPRSLFLADALWDEVQDPNGRYNLALVMKGAAPFLATSQAVEARGILVARKGSGPKTDSLLDDALRLLPLG